jgi:D-3-phosphoglycerate dehydrogenase
MIKKTADQDAQISDTAFDRARTVLVTDRFTQDSLEWFKSQLPDYELCLTSLLPEKDKLRVSVALLIRSRTKIDKEILDQAPHLRVIITATSGYDHIDLAACEQRQIKVMYTPEANSQSAAELTLTLMLGVLRRLNECSRVLRDGRWRDDTPTGHELAGKTVGLIGLGRVGSRVAQLLQAFQCHVLAHDPYQSDEVFQKLGIERLGMTEVFTQAEILSLHVPLTAETRRLIRSETLELTQEGLIFINTSRGKVVDETALVTALESRQIAGAGLDVFENEPLARESRLRKMPNVLITPHVGAFTEEAFGRASLRAVQKLVNFLTRGEISDNLPPQVVL